MIDYSLTHRSAHPFKAAEHIWLVHVYIRKSNDARLHCTNSIIHGVFHLSTRFPGERRLSCHRMSGCHTWTKTHSWDGRLSGGLSTSRCHDGPLQWWRLCAGLSDTVTTSAEIMNQIKQPSIFFFSKMQASIERKFIYVVSDANEVFMFFFLPKFVLSDIVLCNRLKGIKKTNITKKTENWERLFMFV